MMFVRKYLGLVFSHIPGLVFLFFSMLALFTALQLMAENDQLQNYYSFLSHQPVSVEDGSVRDKKIKTFLDRLEGQEDRLYWAIIAVGLSGFVLIVLNADKLRKLEAANTEKQTALKLLKRRLAAMEATRDGIGIVDENGNLIYMNEALMDLHGIAHSERADYIGHPWVRLYNEKGQAYIQEVLMPSLEDSGYWRGETPLMRKDGMVIEAEMSLTRLNDGGFIGTARDISQRKQDEQEKKLLQDQFFQAQKMEAVGRLAGGVAHDFNNILSAIHGYAEFLTEDLKDQEEQRVFAENILQATGQGRQLIDQILAFSRHKESKTEVIDLTKAVSGSLALLKASLPKSVKLKENLPDEEYLIQGNGSQISQIVMNLGVNGRDAIGDQEGEIEIRIAIQDPHEFYPSEMTVDGFSGPDDAPQIRIEEINERISHLFAGNIEAGREYVCLSIRDSGHGMSREILEHVLEPFFTTKPADKGTGLGLSTVHGVMTSHAGAIFIETGLRDGTVFKLLFPLAEEGRAASKEDKEHISAPHGGKILFVDDQEEIRDVMVSRLKRLGFDVEACAGGLEALDTLRENPGAFDLVITDQSMPKMTGVELVQQAHMDNPGLPFILISGYSQQELYDVMRNHEAVKDILHKPVLREDLARAINDVLAEKKPSS